jgi:hypothetical protein
MAQNPNLIMVFDKIRPRGKQGRRIQISPQFSIKLNQGVIESGEFESDHGFK